ncbi:MAG TPA: phosphotransferase, partial [Candidatus Polarisedimenticolaceae bacterium]|nr:phosphotransferase [Candidatus Polarisedimenticolaceae bacterium]
MFVTTDDSKYVLRVYPRDAKGNQEIILELDFMSVLRREDLPVPKVIPSLAKDTLVIADIEGHTWQCVLMEYASGSHPTTYTPALIKHMAYLQAKMHTIGAAYAQSHELPQAIDTLKESVAAGRLLQDKNIDPYYREYLERVKDYEVGLDDTLPIGLSHFDYDIDNLFVQN